MVLFLAMLILAAVAAAMRTHRTARHGPSDGGEEGAYPLELRPAPGRVAIPQESRYQHLDIVGATGTGKNYHALLPMLHQDIRRGAGVVVVDPKGSMRAAVTAYARAAGREGALRCLDLADPERSDTYNPLLGDDPGLVADRVHAALFAEDATPTPFYRDMALAFFHPFFALCRRLEVLPTLDQLRRVCADQLLLAGLVGAAHQAPEARELRRAFLRQAPTEYARNLQGVANGLTPLAAGPFAAALGSTSPSLVVADLLEGSGILYAGLASDQYPAAHHKVATLLLMDLQAALTRRYRARPAPVFVYLDEFADLLYPQVRALVAKAREGRVGLVVAHQSLGDLKRHGAAVAESVYENTSNKLILRQGSPESAEALARLSGWTPGARPTLSVHRAGLRGRKRQRGERAADQTRFDPDALLGLGVGEAYAVVQRPDGRSLHRLSLPAAPSLPAGPPSSPHPGARRLAPLELAPPPEPRPLRGVPTTPEGAAALELMRTAGRKAPEARARGAARKPPADGLRGPAGD